MTVVSSKAVYTGYQIETTNWTPALPNKFIPQIENSLDKNIENINSESRFNILNNVIYMARWTNKIQWNIKTELDPINSLVWFYMLMGSITSTDVSSLTDGSVFKHVIKDYVCGYKSVTIENKKGWCIALWEADNNIIVQRSFGIVPASTKLAIEPNKIIDVENEVRGAWMFDVAFLIANEKVEVTTVAITTITPSAVTWTSTYARVVSATHSLVLNDLVKVAWNSVTWYNWYWKVVNVVDGTTFDIDLTIAWAAWTGWTVNRISMRYFWTNSVAWLLSWDTCVLRNSLGSYENVVVRYVDTANSVVWFDSVTSTTMTVANSTNLQLLAQVDTISAPDFFAFSSVSLRMWLTIALATAAAPTDFEKIDIEFNKNVTDIIQNLKNISVPTGLDVNLMIDKAYEGNTERDLQRNATEMAVIIDFVIQKVISATDTNNQRYAMRITMPKVVFQKIEIKDDNNDVIKESITWVSKYDTVNAYSTQIEIWNNKAQTYYTA